jgi:hypothetical protein
MLIIEILFLITGLWLTITGKIPSKLFRLLFGKGQYTLSETKTRVYGLFLATPIPLTFLVSVFLGLLRTKNIIGIVAGFEFCYNVIIIIISIIVARKIRHKDEQQVVQPVEISSTEIAAPIPQKTRSYGIRLLMMVGVVILFGITIISFTSLISVIFSTLLIGTAWTGDFWQDIFPFIATIAIFGLGLFGLIKLFKLMNKKKA